MKKRLLSLSMVLIFLLLTACQDKPKTDTVTPTPDSKLTGETEKMESDPLNSTGNDPAQEANLYKFESPIVVSTAKIVYDVNIYPEGQTPDNNDIYKAIEQVMNIKFENKFAVPFDAYKQKIKLGMASSDLPDIFTVDEVDLPSLIKDDLVEDLTPYYEKYASENLKRVMQYNDGAALAPSTRQGKYYGMPNISDALNSVPVLWIRQDWLNALNKKAPVTKEEFMDLALAFSEQDPDKNGKKDTYGIAMSKELDMRFTALANMYRVYPKIYAKDQENSFTYGSIQPEVKTVLGELNKLYKAGAIDPEFASKDLSKMAETVSQGKVGMFIGEFFSPLWPIADSIQLIDGIEWIGVPMPEADYTPFVKINAMGAHVVRKGAEHPEALIIYLNNVVEAGYENPDNEWSQKYAELSAAYVNNGVNNWMPMLFDLPDANASKLEKYKQVDASGDASILAPNQKNVYDLILKSRDGDKEQWAWQKTYFEGVETAISYPERVYDAWYLAPTTTMKLKGSSLKTLEDTVFINIIAGSATVDSFDQFCSDWLAQGGEQILTEMAAEKE